MKKSKLALNALILGTVCVLTASITTVAIYIGKAADQSFNINIKGTYDAEYRIKNLVAADPDAKLNPENRTIAYTYTLGADINADSSYTQPYITGNFKVSVSTTNEALGNLIHFSNVLDYEEDTVFYQDSYRILGNGEVSNVESKYEITGSTNATVDVNGTTGTLYLYLPENLTSEQYLSIGGSNIDISLEFGEKSADYVNAYVLGTDPFSWSNSDYGMMVPNIKASVSTGYQWMWVAPTNLTNFEYKCNIGGDYGWESILGNHSVTSMTQGQTIYWKGAGNEAGIY